MSDRPHAQHSIIRPGTGRLSVVSGYFLLVSALGAFVAAATAVALVLPGRGWTLVPLLPPAIAIPAAMLVSIASFQTGRLLDRHRRSGAILAIGWFTLQLGGYAAQVNGLLSLVVSIVGLVVMASVWRHLR